MFPASRLSPAVLALNAVEAVCRPRHPPVGAVEETRG